MKRLVRFARVIALLALPGVGAPAQTDAPTTGTTVLAEDPGARTFLARCSGCHTIGGGAVVAPDLEAASRWPESDLRPKIKTMEKQAGPLAEEDISAIVEFLRSGSAKERLAEQERLAAEKAMASQEAPSAVLGEALFHGRRPLLNGGPACASCHVAGGVGGNLGPDLTTVGSRMSEMALRSGIEKANYLVMKPVYTARPITPQEASHLAAYLQQQASNPATPRAWDRVEVIGLAAAMGLLAALAMLGRGEAAGTRRRLVQQANRR